MMVNSMKTIIGLSILIVTIIVIRAIVEGKISRKAQYAMWLSLPIFVIVASLTNLYIPVKVQNHDYSVSRVSSVEMSNHPSKITVVAEDNSSPAIVEDTVVKEVSNDSLASSDFSEKTTDTVDNVETQPVTKNINYKHLCKIVWICGAIIVASSIVINNAVFYVRLIKNRKFIAISQKKNLRIYKLSNTKSPFLFGRGIYLTDDISLNTLQYEHAVCHEYCHYKQGDNIWVIVRYIFIVAFWFNPLIWIASEISSRDGELAVDEQVIKILGANSKRSYSETLLSLLTLEASKDHLIVSTSMSGKNKSFMKTRVVNIMKGSKRNIALTIIVSILLSVVVGCNLFNKQNVREATYVNEDSLWYDCTQTLYGNEQYELCGVSKLFMRPEVVTNTMRIFELVVYDDEYSTTGTSMTPTSLLSYSLSGELIGSINVDANLNDGEFISSIFEVNNECRVIINNIITNTWKIGTLDFESSCITNVRDAAIGSRIQNDGFWEVMGDEDKIYLEFQYLEDSTYKYGLMITDLDGNVEFEMKLPYEYLKWSVNSNGDIYGMGHNNTSMDFTYEFFTLDLETGNIEKLNVSEDIINRYMGNTMMNGDYAYMKNEDNTITRLNIATLEEDVIFDYNCSYANFNDMSNYDLSYIDEDEIVLYRNGTYFGPKEDYYGREVIHLTLSESNPNAGKQILTLASVNDIFPVEGYAISTFNQTNDEYFITVDTKYDAYRYYRDENNEIDTYDKAYKYIMDMLYVDINAGVGPDILLNAGMYPQFCTSNMLVDLNQYIDGNNGINRDEYFNSCFVASNVNGKLYQIPTSVHVKALLIDPETVSEDRTGFTFSEFQTYSEEYGYYDNRFLNTENSFHSWFTTSESQFIDENGHLNIDNEDFRDLINLVNSASEGTINTDVACSLSFYEFYTTLIDPYNGITRDKLNWQLCGIPSADGSSAMLSNSLSCGITVCSSSRDGCWEFIKHALSEQVQDECTEMPININSFDRIGNYWIEYGNQYKLNTVRIENYFSSDTLDIIKSWINSVDHCWYQYPVANIIIDEEMPAYFNGDKSIDEVIVIITDRVNRMLDEQDWG